MDYYLKAESAEALQAALATLDSSIAVDVIGEIPAKSLSVLGVVEVKVQMLPGFHANLRGELTAEQEASLPLIDRPEQPYRVWA